MKRTIYLLLIILLLTGCSGDLQYTTQPSSPDDSSITPSTVAEFVETESCEKTSTLSDTTTYTRPEVLDTPTYIEQEFIEVLKKALEDNNEYEVLKNLTSGKLLTTQELADIDLGITEHLIQELESDLRHEVILVDADNDGIDDIILYLHSGGSMGLVNLEFYKGSQEGIYENTYSGTIGIYTENAFVKYNGKNYFLFTAIDYNRKVRTGFELFCFSDGVAVEYTRIEEIPESYSLSTQTVTDHEYDTFSNQLARNGQEIYFNLNIVGSAETKLDEDKNTKANDLRKTLQGSPILVVSSWYSADIDNDGMTEMYTKSIFEPSNNHTFRHLTSNIIKNSQEYYIYEECGLDIEADGRIPQYLWVDNVNDKNIVCVLSTRRADADTKDNFEIDCYYINRNTYQTIARFEFSPSYKITVEIYTHGINRDFINQGPSDWGKG